MDNPYQAPQSNVDNGIVEVKSKKGWKIYFWFILLISIVSVSSVVIDNDLEFTFVEKIISFCVYPIVSMGIFGLAYSKRFFAPIFWKLWMLVSLVADAYSLPEIFKMDMEFAFDWELYIYYGVITALLLPITIIPYIGLYFYAFKSPEIWNKQSNNES